MIQMGEKTDVDIKLEALRLAQGDLSKAKEFYEWLSGKHGNLENDGEIWGFVKAELTIHDGSDVLSVISENQPGGYVVWSAVFKREEGGYLEVEYRKIS